MTDVFSAAAQARDFSGSVERGGFRLTYRCEGQGEPVLVIGSADYYARCFPAFTRDRFRFYFLDHCGFAARTDGQADDDFSLDRIVDDIEGVRRQLGVKRFAILGHSGHGYMALAYAARFPDRVSRVVMVATAPSQSELMLKAAEHRFEAHADPERKAILAKDLAQLEADIAAEPGARFRHLLVRLGARSWHDPGYDARPLWQGIPINDRVFDHLWGEVFRDIDIRALATKIEVPVLIALGASDYLIAPPESWDEFLPVFRKVDRVVFANSGHTPPLEEPEAFAQTLLGFVEN